MRRHKRRKLLFVLPVVAFVLMSAGLIAVWLQTRPLEPLDLRAAVLTDFSFPDSTVEKSLAPDASGQYENVRNALNARPQTLSSELMHVEFGASDVAITVRIRKASETRIVAVAIDAHPNLLEFARQKAIALNNRRRLALKTAAANFLERYARAVSDGSAFNIGGFRDAVGLNTQRRGLGFALEAVANRQLCPCVHEDDHRLFFLIPGDLGSFEIQGRVLPDGSKPFPFLCRVTIDPGQPGVNEDAAESIDPVDEMNETAIDEPDE